MIHFWQIFTFFGAFVITVTAGDTDLRLDNLFSEIQTVLNAEGGQTRQHQYPYRPQNNGISLGVYEALRSIAKNDELQCVSRLLCEAAAGGQPGYSGKQIKFDKASLIKLMSYLNLDTGSSSPLLTFGKAALLGVSNRGDPYSCIINYPKCPKDQSRLLYYLNNHRGGFFQYFDKQHHKPGNYFYQHQHRPGYGYHQYQKKFKRNKIQFERPGGLYDELKKKATSHAYATKYSYSKLSFPRDDDKRSRPMVFPVDDGLIDPRILTKPVRASTKENKLFFSGPTRFPKKAKDFFPQSVQTRPAAISTDRLPNRFNFPENENPYGDSPTRYSSNSFFPIS